jgi:hypothetical protein
MQALIIALVGKVVEVLAKILLVPFIKEWRQRNANKAEDKRLEEENKAKGDAYAKADANSAADDFSKLP